jgi:hypothetical protein
MNSRRFELAGEALKASPKLFADETTAFNSRDGRFGFRDLASAGKSPSYLMPGCAYRKSSVL